MAGRVLAAALLAVVLAGCGSSHARKPPPTRAGFAKAADRICAGAKTRTTLIADLRTLRAPVGSEDTYAHWLKAEQDALKAVTPPDGKPDPDAPDPRILLAIAEGKIAGYARRLGATTCAERATGTLPP